MFMYQYYEGVVPLLPSRHKRVLVTVSTSAKSMQTGSVYVVWDP
jgi:hypothetical protein